MKTEPCAPVSNQRQHPLLTAKEMAQEHGVSERTGRRMRGYSYIPEALVSFSGKHIPARTTGKDGKSYPHCRSRYHREPRGDAVRRSLGQSASLLRKADRQAQEHGFSDAALNRLQAMAAQCTEMLSRWESTSLA